MFDSMAAQYARRRSRPMVIDWPDRVQDCQKAGPGISGPVSIAEGPPNCDGQVLMLVKLEDLVSQHRRAWKSRQVKKAYSIEAEMISLRLDILRAGRGNH